MRSNKCRTKLRIRFNHTDLDDIEDIYFPNEGHCIKRSPMRRRYNKDGTTPHVEWYSDLGHGHCSWHTTAAMIDGYLTKNIGNKFDDVFSKFLKKHKNKSFHCYGYHNIRSMFLREFESNSYKRIPGEYYVDDEGLIQQVPYRRRQSKDIVVYKPQPWVRIYTLKENALLSISVPFISYFGEGLYEKILSTKEFNTTTINTLCIKMRERYPYIENVFNQVRKYREYKPLIYYLNNSFAKWIYFLFNIKDDSIERIIKYGTKEYYQYLKKKKQAKAAKSKKNLDRTEYINTLKTRKLLYNAKQ